MRPLAVLVVAAALWLTPATAAGQGAPVVVRSEVDRATMAMGDQVLLTVTVELASGYRLLDPGVPRAIGDFEVVDTLTVLETRAGGVTRTQLRFLITAFQLGPKRIPVIGVTYRAPTAPKARPGRRMATSSTSRAWCSPGRTPATSSR